MKGRKRIGRGGYCPRNGRERGEGLVHSLEWEEESMEDIVL